MTEEKQLETKLFFFSGAIYDHNTEEVKIAMKKEGYRPKAAQVGVICHESCKPQVYTVFLGIKGKK